VSGERGFALIITLLVTALLVATVTEFIHDVFVETSLRQSYADSQQASLVAASGIAGGVKLVQKEIGGRDYSSLLDKWASPQQLEDERGSLKVTISEESGKLDINSIVFPNGKLNEAYCGIALRLLDKLKLPVDLCDTAVDWIDTDDSLRPGGAESGYYKSLQSPYAAKNLRLETYEELRMVKGFDEDILSKLNPFLTVYPETRGAPFSKINVNTAPTELLAVLDERMTDDLAARIVDARKTSPLKSSADITRIAGLETIGIALQGKIAVKGSIFRIQSRAQVRETVRIVEAVVRISGTQSVVLYWREL